MNFAAPGAGMRPITVKLIRGIAEFPELDLPGPALTPLRFLPILRFKIAIFKRLINCLDRKEVTCELWSVAPDGSGTLT